MPSYYFEWRKKVHYCAGPVLETGDLQQTPSLQEGELVLVPEEPVHHAGPVLETEDLQQIPSLQEGELVLVPVGPVHHAGPVLA